MCYENRTNPLASDTPGFSTEAARRMSERSDAPFSRWTALKGYSECRCAADANRVTGKDPWTALIRCLAIVGKR